VTLLAEVSSLDCAQAFCCGGTCIRAWGEYRPGLAAVHSIQLHCILRYSAIAGR
jgi:hypothetical protein